MIDLVNCPDWLDTAVYVDGMRLDVDTCAVVEHERVLDLRDGVLTRSTVFEDADGRRTRLETVRCACMADRRICALRVEVTPENHDGQIVVETGIDGDRRNLEALPVYPAGTDFTSGPAGRSGRSPSTWTQTARSDGDTLYLQMRTLDTGVELGFLASTTFAAAPVHRAAEQRSERVTERTVHGGGPVRLDKLVAICTSRDSTRPAPLPDRCRAALTAHDGFDAIVAASAAVWEQLWDGVRRARSSATSGHPGDAVRHLPPADHGEPGRPHGQHRREVAVRRGLPGPRVLGHRDPHAAVLHPHPARHGPGLLALPPPHAPRRARATPASTAPAGPATPWESADTGDEECPEFTPDGANRFWTREEEVHVSADVAYGIYPLRRGHRRHAPSSTTTAPRSCSRPAGSGSTGSRWRTDGRLRAAQVMGPDEFHSHIDDNAFTNFLVQWHLTRTAAAVRRAARPAPRGAGRRREAMGLKPDERDRWRAVADGHRRAARPTTA